MLGGITPLAVGASAFGWPEESSAGNVSVDLSGAKRQREGVMGREDTVVDRNSPEAISAAIKHVNGTPGLRIGPSIKALWTPHRAPAHSMLRSELDARFGALDLHFGWFCRRVAKELGADDPDPLALVNVSTDDEGRQVFTLKPAVVAACPKM